MPLEHALALVVLAGLVGFTANRIAACVTPEASIAARITAFGACSIVEISLVMQLLGAIGLLYLLPVAILELVVAIAVVLLVPRAHYAKQERAVRRWIPTLVLLATIVAVVAVLSFNGVTQEYDSFRYHVLNASTWLNNGSVWQMPVNYPGDASSTNPGNGELLGVWLMLASHSDEMAYVVNLLLGVVICSAVIWMLQLLRANVRSGTILLLALLCSPFLFVTEVHAMTVDFAWVAPMLSAVAIIVATRDTPRMKTTILSGLLLGIAVGTKYPALPACICVVIFTLMFTGIWRRPRLLMALLGAMIVAGSLWYIRNWVEVGDPIYPGRLAIGSVVLFAGAGVYSSWGPSIVGRLLDREWSFIPYYIGLVAQVMGPVALSVAAVISLISRGRSLPREVWYFVALSLAMIIAFAAAPLSAPGFNGGYSAVLDTGALRYALGGFVIGLVAVASILPAPMVLALGTAGLVYDVVEAIVSPNRQDLVLTTGTVVTALLVAVVLAALFLAWQKIPARGVSMKRRCGAWALGCAAGIGLTTFLFAANRAVADPVLARARSEVASTTPTVMVGVFNERSLLGPNLDDPVTTIGNGPVGTVTAVDAGTLNRIIESHAPTVVAAGSATADQVPAGWKPEPTWRRIGVVGDSALYFVPPNP